MWKYIKPYLHFAIIAAAFMVGEVLMDLIQPQFMSQIVDNGVLGLGNNGVGDMHLIFVLGLQMICLVLIGGTCGSLNNVFVHMSSQNIGNEMRKDCFRSIMKFSQGQMDKYGTGSLVTRVTNDITQVQNFVAQFVRGMIRNFMLTFGSIYFCFRLNRTFGIIVLLAFPFIAGTLIVCLKKATPLFTKLQTQLDNINAIMQEDVSGIRIIKACVRESYEKIRFGKANGELIATQLKVLIIFAFMNPIINMLMYIVVACILAVGSYQVGAGGATPGTIMAAITYTTQLLNGIMMLTMLFQNISRGLVSWKRVKEILDTKPDLEDGKFDKLPQLQGEIEFRNVSFKYPQTNQTVLDNINLSIHKGETIAIMGETGCGKSSLVSLIPRFYDVTGGAVLVDGVDVREYNQKVLRQKVAIALQKSELFTETISENIAWGKDDATGIEIKNAAQIAQADEFIDRMPEGYDTPVAERGMSLSGGQKQRLSIARAIVKNAEILIFDDSTSALDLKTEANLYKALNEANPESTKIIIAQRIASVKNADRIVVLNQGKIEAFGTHEEMMTSSKTYKDIYDSQMGEGGENYGR
jgi:ATP-binding cassette subfamily B protein